MDRDNSERIAENTDGNGIYEYSYTVSSVVLNVNCGFTSIIDRGIGFVQPFKLSGVRNPALKIMIAEEQATLKGGESSDPTGDVMNDGRYAPSGPARGGDAFTVAVGCDHTPATCAARFANLARFRGFPYVPPPQLAY